MKVIQHGAIVIFKCKECGCESSEVAKKCYSSTGESGADYCMSCPDCGETCWVIGDVQRTVKESNGTDL